MKYLFLRIEQDIQRSVLYFSSVYCKMRGNRCVWQVENAQFGSHFVPNLATRFQVPKAHVAIGNSRQ